MSLFNKAKANMNKSKLKRFDTLTKGADKSKKRACEQRLLKPAPIPLYTGEKATAKGIESLTIHIVLPDEQVKKELGHWFRISQSQTTGDIYISDIDLLLNLIKGLENNTIKYNKQAGTFTMSAPKLRRRRIMK